jgi:hypothetical protein
MGGKNSGRFPSKDYPGGISTLTIRISKDLHNEFKEFCVDNNLSQPAMFELLYKDYKNFQIKMDKFINGEPEEE